MGPVGVGPHPWPAPNQLIFIGLPPIIFWTWPMVVLGRVELVWFDFGLVLQLF
jgi:hypothetical protein